MKPRENVAKITPMEKAVDHCQRVPEMDGFIVCEDHV